MNVPKLIFENLKMQETVPNIGAYEEGICMMKYNEIMIQRVADDEIVM